MACNKALSTVACSFQFTNIADEDLYLLKRNTPLEGFFSPFLNLSTEGRPVQYEGIYASRIAPTKDEFVLLKAGESIAASVQITDVFNIDTDGLYTLQYSKPLQYLSVDEMSIMSNGEVRESAVHESIYIYLENTHLLLKPTKPEETDKVDYTVHLQDCASASFKGGDKKNGETLKAHKSLCAGTDKAKGNVSDTAEYKTWFGTYTAARAEKVKTVYQKMKDGISGKTVTYYNNGPQCKSNWYAYTYHGSTTVYLCPVFYGFKIPCIGNMYTKESSLAHEWSHAFGLTEDYAYHVGGCQSLAKSDPDKAVVNADSIRFFYCKYQMPFF